MAEINFGMLRQFDGHVVLLRSTEGENMRARVVHVDREHQDIVLDILDTDQPARYESLGKPFARGSWVIPFGYIAEISLVE